MNIAKLSDQDLHQKLMELKSKESHIVALIVSHLEGVYRRRLFADFGCSSIYDYCIRILGYSNGEAHRKISACKLASQISGVRESIAAGELSLSNAASVQMLVSKLQSVGPASVSLESIGSIVERVKNKSTRQCEKELHKIAQEHSLPIPVLTATRRNVNDLAQLKVCVSRENLDALKIEMGITSEQELIEQLIANKLMEIRESKKAAFEAEVKLRAHKLGTKPRSISRSKRAIVIKKAEGKCQNCGTSSRLEIDHRQSVAKGGGNDLNNLRVLCRSCNQRAAIQQLGLETMQPYLNSRTRFTTRRDPRAEFKSASDSRNAQNALELCVK